MTKISMSRNPMMLNPRSRFAAAAALIALIAAADWRAQAEVPLGFLYLLPMLIVGTILPVWQIAAVAAVCTWLAELFDDYGWSLRTGLPRDILYFAAFFGMGILVYTVTRSRKLALQHLGEIERESQARMDAEEQLAVLIHSSPAAILTADVSGNIVLANDAAHRLFAAPPGTLQQSPLAKFLPALANVPAQGRGQTEFRTMMQCRGRRGDGEVFQADVWFSTYGTTQGARLAAVVMDTSEDLREREENSLHHLLTSSRILVSAVSHEVRNVCGAIAVVHQNLLRDPALAGSKDFETLGTLILALEKIAAMELRQMTPGHSASQATSVDLASLLEELRIVVDPALREEQVEVRWEIDAGLPLVWADRQSLMQAFLNLVKNSERAMLGRPQRVLTVIAQVEECGKGSAAQCISLHFHDTGPGVPEPERLFRPFQPDAQSTGLGLYISRALVRSFGGDLRYERTPDGACFAIELQPAFALPSVPTSESREEHAARN